ncbi:hypothetical protein [Methylocystis sp. S23]|jgi:hypothetical protein
MIQNRSCVNGILAAVLSASIVPTHGALAKEKAPAPHKTAAKKTDHPAAHKVDKPEAPKDEAAKPEASGAGAPATVTQ